MFQTDDGNQPVTGKTPTAGLLVQSGGRLPELGWTRALTSSRTR
jgi:hypothetical protein